MIAEIVSPKKVVFSEDVDFVILPGDEGDFGVLDKHSPIVSSLRLGPVSYTHLTLPTIHLV